MDQEQLIVKPAKYDRVNILSKVFCTWVYSTFIKGLKREINVNDLYKCPVTDESEQLVLTLEHNWNKECSKKSPSFARANIRTFWPRMFWLFNLVMIEECIFRISQPLMLGYVINFFAAPDKYDYMYACLSATGVVVSTLLYVACYHPTGTLAGRVAQKARVAWGTIIYKKALKLKSSAFEKTTVGQILNLMSNDMSTFDEFCILSPYMFAAPIQVVIAMYICWLYIGWYCLIGLGLLFLFIPFNSLMGRIFFTIRTKVASLSDNRFLLMNEIIKGMAVIKMYAWERHFSKLISDARKKEMSRIRNAALLRGLIEVISEMSGRVILFTIYVVYVLRGEPLTADKVFVTMAVMNSIRLNMTWFFPHTIALTSQLYVSCKRVQKYLLLDEMDHKNKNYFYKNCKNILIDDKHLINHCTQRTGGISIEDMSAKWSQESDLLTLNSITAYVNQGEVLAVIGPVGAGKSSFLMSLLNEISITSGSVRVDGSIAYASQESWTFNTSVAQNIRFGKAFDANKWKDVISVCAMERDLKLFPHAEETLVGERGVQLSGGQKARITLARALYNDADIFLLDDPLSAVDSDVAKHIFEKCITEYLKSKTVVLVTHQIQFIKSATKILVLKEGRLMAFGSYDELCAKGIDFMSLIAVKKTENEDQLMLTIGGDTVVDGEEAPNGKLFLSQTSLISSKSETERDISEQKLVDETKESGAIDSRVYWQYFRSGAGPVLMTLTILSTVGSQVLNSYSDLWLTQWTNEENKRNITAPFDQTPNVTIFSSLLGVAFLTMIIRKTTFLTMGIIASVKLHNTIFFRLMRAPIAFFQTNPIGRILNRFTKDMGIVDESLPQCLYDLNLITTEIIGTIIVVAIVNWFLIFPALLMIFLILIVRWIYIKTARDLKRFENMARSPIINHMTTTLSGLSTIRAFNAQDMFRRQYYRYQNDHTASNWMCFSSSRALGVVMDSLCLAYIASVTLVLMIFYENIEGGSAGLAITVALGLTGMTQWGVRQSAEAESQMTSVERILEYSRLESEAELESVTKPPIDWPQEGRIVFKDVYLTYENSQKPTLQGLNCEIRPGEKVGVVGRTGAGKSSILSALFRMFEIDGNITIDGIDCKTIGLHDLRKRLSIIPQDPIAFIGSLRNNLDPFDEHSEDRLWAALEEVQLRDVVNEWPAKLDHQLSESGGNLSVGQRQLICLARAILRHNRILVLDEATANVDHKTDSLIQKTIRHTFAESTVLTIAHRLNTIIDSDRVLVLDAGRIVEFDVPYLLLQNSTGMLTKLVKQTGHVMASELLDVAKQSYEKMTTNER